MISFLHCPLPSARPHGHMIRRVVLISLVYVSIYLLGPDVKSDPKSPSLLSASPRLFRKGSKTSRVSFGSVRVEGDEKVDAGM